MLYLVDLRAAVSRYFKTSFVSRALTVRAASTVGVGLKCGSTCPRRRGRE